MPVNMSKDFRKAPVVWILAAYVPYVIIGTTFLGFTIGELWWLAPAIYLFVVVPILDWLLPEQRLQFSENEYSRGQLIALRVAPISFCIVYMILLVVLLFTTSSLSFMELLYATLSLGAITSIAITAAHECVHKRNSPEGIIGRLTMILAGEPSFHANHPFGHHRYACTKQDVSTGWKGESFWHFLFRTLYGCFRAAWRVQIHERQSSRHLDLKAKLIVILELSSIIWITILVEISLGIHAAFLWLGQAAIAVLLLEAISYIQHYGLLRELPDGSIDSMGPMYTWNTYKVASSHMTFMLTRHADHHRSAGRPFYLLQIESSARDLPAGYPAMVMVALLPFLWFRIMDGKITYKSDPNLGGALF